MQILVDYTSAVRQTAGIGRITQELVRHFPWEEAGLEPRLFVSGRNRNAVSTVDGRPLHYTPLREHDMTRLWHRADSPWPRVEWFTGGNPQIFHATDFVLSPSGAPCQILTVHDLAFHKFRDTAETSLTRYLDTVVPRSVARADFIIADSHSTARDLEHMWQVSGDRIAVVPGGIDPQVFHRVEHQDRLDAVRTRYGIGDAPYLLGLSTLQPRKNFVRLVEAFHRIAAAYPEMVLVIGGKRGWKYQDLFARVLELDLEARVLFPGFVAEPDLPALYSSAALFAYPSLYEGFGIPILEAMACGTPVLTGRNSSLAEAGGPGALYVDTQSVEDMAAGLDRILSDAGLRTAMTAAGTRHVARMGWDRSARLLWQAYRQAWASVH